MKNADILIVGGDLRSSWCRNILKDSGHNVNYFLVPECTPYSTSLEVLKKHINNSKYVLCPIPFSRDSINITTSAEYSEVRLSIELLLSLVGSNHTIIGGSFSNNITELFIKKGISFYDLTQFDSFTYANARLTAEGLLKDIIEYTPFSISGSKILVLGYGFCGSAIAKTLRSLGGDVTVYNRNKYYNCKAKSLGFCTLTDLPAQQYLSEYDIIINTIPNVIYTKEHLLNTSKSAYLFDVASAPGGFHTDTIKQLKLPYYNSPGIPGKTSPKTAANIICDVINEEIG